VYVPIRLRGNAALKAAPYWSLEDSHADCECAQPSGNSRPTVQATSLLALGPCLQSTRVVVKLIMKRQALVKRQLIPFPPSCVLCLVRLVDIFHTLCRQLLQIDSGQKRWFYWAWEFPYGMQTPMMTTRGASKLEISLIRCRFLILAA
jgi:hypothetical protein